MNKVSPGQNETFHIIIPQAINKSLCRQMPKVYDISGRYHSRYRIRKHEKSKKAKISIPAFPAYASILMHLNNNSRHTTKSVVSFKKDFKIPLYPIKIPQQFGFHMYAVVKTHVTRR